MLKTDTFSNDKNLSVKNVSVFRVALGFGITYFYFIPRDQFKIGPTIDFKYSFYLNSPSKIYLSLGANSQLTFGTAITEIQCLISNSKIISEFERSISGSLIDDFNEKFSFNLIFKITTKGSPIGIICSLHLMEKFEAINIKGRGQTLCLGVYISDNIMRILNINS